MNYTGQSGKLSWGLQRVVTLRLGHNALSHRLGQRLQTMGL